MHELGARISSSSLLQVNLFFSIACAPRVTPMRAPLEVRTERRFSADSGDSAGRRRGLILALITVSFACEAPSLDRSLRVCAHTCVPAAGVQRGHGAAVQRGQRGQRMAPPRAIPRPLLRVIRMRDAAIRSFMHRGHALATVRRIRMRPHFPHHIPTSRRTQADCCILYFCL